MICSTNMKFRSILSYSPELRTNTNCGLLLVIIFSLQTLISSIEILPKDQTKAIWNTQSLFLTCNRDKSETEGVLKWFAPNGEPIEDNNKAPFYVQESGRSLKLFIMSSPKKHSGIYQCKHIVNGNTINTANVSIKIFNSIDMKGNKDSHTGIEGHTFTMPCMAKFDSELSDAQTELQWTHNNLPIKSGEGQFTFENVVNMNPNLNMKNIKNILKIKNLTKENEGLYVCEANYGNQYLTGVKSIDIDLRVQFKPRFPENTRRNVWISDSQNSISNPIEVNVTCLVNADPPANFYWTLGNGRRISSDFPLKHAKHSIHSAENLSVLRLEYNDINQIRNNFGDPEGNNKKFQCSATNKIGEATMTFVLNIGQLPQSPILDRYHYTNVLSVNNTEVEPPIDIYRVEIDSHHVYFNASNRIANNNNTYEINVDVPTGIHQFIVYAHNPVGWSESYDPHPPLQLVISGSPGAQQYLTLLVMALFAAAVNAF